MRVKFWIDSTFHRILNTFFVLLNGLTQHPSQRLTAVVPLTGALMAFSAFATGDECPGQMFPGQTYNLPRSINLSGPGSGVASGDFNGDGLTDKAETNTFGNSVVLALKKCVILGDIDQDGVVTLLDVQPFVQLLTISGYQAEADINQDGVVNLLDVGPFVELLPAESFSGRFI